MPTRRKGKYIDADSHLVIEHDGVKVYRNHNNIFFMEIPHDKGDLDFEYEGLDFSKVTLARCDTILKKVKPKFVEKWVMKHCPESFDDLYDTKSDAPYRMLLPFSKVENRQLNRIMAHDDQERRRLEIIEEVVKTWLNEENKKLDEQIK